MKPLIRTSVLVLSLATALLLASCGRKKAVIPRDELAEIYAEMFVLDQWINDNGSLRRKADTTMVYAPVLEKYGYDYDDYLNSLGYYMKDPARYSKILRTTSEILNGRLSELKTKKEEQRKALLERQRRDSLRRIYGINIDSLFAAMRRTNPSDSLTVGWDSLNCITFRFVQSSDSCYDGPRLVVRTDSVAVQPADSLSPSDVQPADSVHRFIVKPAEGVRRYAVKPADSVNQSIVKPADGSEHIAGHPKHIDNRELSEKSEPLEDSLKFSKNASLRHDGIRPGAQPAFRRLSRDKSAPEGR